MTAEEYMALPEDSYRGYDLVRGRPRKVSEPWAGFYHGSRQFEIAYLLKKFLEQHPIATLAGDCSITLARNPDTVRAPDICVVRNERYPKHYTNGPIFDVAPDLVIEIRSPSERPGILKSKIRDYMTAGTSVVWVVDQDKRTVAVYKSTDAPPRIIAGDERLTGDPVLPGFSCTLAELFR
jgi:Uma2 family endonuclease